MGNCIQKQNKLSHIEIKKNGKLKKLKKIRPDEIVDVEFFTPKGFRNFNNIIADNHNLKKNLTSCDQFDEINRNKCLNPDETFLSKSLSQLSIMLDNNEDEKQLPFYDDSQENSNDDDDSIAKFKRSNYYDIRPMPTPLRFADQFTPGRPIEKLFSSTGRPKSNKYVLSYIKNKRLLNSN